jgi:DNA modification methylase
VGDTTILVGDVLEQLVKLPGGSVQCVVTSPPYWGLRDYGHAGQIGLEPTVGEYVEKMVAVFREVRRVLRDDGTLWLNLGDSYTSGGNTTRDPGKSKKHPAFAGDDNKMKRNRPATPEGLKPKDLVGIPWRVAFALQDDGWYLRQDIIWHKPNPIPESVQDRCTKAHEYVFLMSKSERYFYNKDAVAEKAIGVAGGRNRRSVWTIPSEPYYGVHFATFPTELPRTCILASTRPGDTVLDPFMGSGTTLQVALELGRSAIGIELNEKYADLARSRLRRLTMGLHLEVA